MKLLLSSIFLFITTVSVAQIDYSKQANLLLNAHRAKEINLKEEALKGYLDAFSITESPRGADYIDAAFIAMELNKNELCKKLIIDAIVFKKVDKDFIINYSQNENYQTVAKQVVQNYNDHLSRFYRSLKDPVAYFKIQKLLNRDTETRRLKDYYFGITPKMMASAFDSLMRFNKPGDSLKRKKFEGILSPKLDDVKKEFYQKAMVYADSLNVRELIKITEEHGWQKNGWLILWHQRGSYGEDNWIWAFFKPYINKEIRKGSVPPFFWAKFEDHQSFFKTGKTIYGYWPGKIDPKTVNKARRLVGLPMLTEEEIVLRNTTRGGRIF